MSDIDDVRADIERDREQLVRTVDALSARLDVKARARARVAQVREQTARHAGELRQAATTDEGRPTPQTIAVAAGTVVAVAGVVWLVLRRSRRR